jgi:hypothetical protein
MLNHQHTSSIFINATKLFEYDSAVGISAPVSLERTIDDGESDLLGVTYTAPEAMDAASLDNALEDAENCSIQAD